MKKHVLLLMILPLALPLTACDSAKEELGLTRRTPDEFAVVRRAPLELPPELTQDARSLPVPQPGTPRPQERATVDLARGAILGTDQTPATPAAAGPSAAEQALLSRTGSDQADPSIRTTVDREVVEQYTDEKRPVIKRLMNIGKDNVEGTAKIVDAPAEAQRLQKNKSQGAPASAGETPSIDD